MFLGLYMVVVMWWWMVWCFQDVGGGLFICCRGDWCISYCGVLLCFIVTCYGSVASGTYNRACCNGGHGG